MPVTRGGTDAQPKVNYEPFTPGERQQIMTSLGELQPRSANTKFREELDTIWVGHQLHLRDGHQLVRTACPAGKWRQVVGAPAAPPAQDYSGGRWTHVVALTSEIDAQQTPFTQFKEGIQRVLGNVPINWSRITTTKQLKGKKFLNMENGCSRYIRSAQDKETQVEEIERSFRLLRMNFLVFNKTS